MFFDYKSMRQESDALLRCKLDGSRIFTEVIASVKFTIVVAVLFRSARAGVG